MPKELQARKPYPSDRTDAQWAILEPLIPAAHHQRGRRPRTVDMREVVNTLLYLHRSGCQGEMLLHDLLPKSTVYDDFARWRDDGMWAQMLERLREQTRRHVGREPTPSAACIDTQSVKGTEMGSRERGFDSGKQVSSREECAWAVGYFVRCAQMDVEGNASANVLDGLEASDFVDNISMPFRKAIPSS